MRFPAFAAAAVPVLALAALGSAASTGTAASSSPAPLYVQDPLDPGHDDGDDFFAPPSHQQKDEKLQLAQILMRAYLATARDLGIQTWLMRGSLLGWWWGGKILPWDLEPAVYIPEADLYYLAAYHNMTVYAPQYGGMDGRREFRLEVSPRFDQRDREQEGDGPSSAVDARWTDMESGMSMSILAARYAVGSRRRQGLLYDKLGHNYWDFDIFPLRDASFEDMAVKVPFRYEEMLRSEYGERALTNTNLGGHEFNTTSMRWARHEKGRPDLR